MSSSSSNVPDRIQQASASIAMTDHTVLAAIFGSFCTAIGRAFIENLGKKILFPISALLTFMQWALTMVQIWKDVNSTMKSRLIRASISTLASVTIITAVALAIFATTTIVPFLFCGAIATGLLESMVNLYRKWPHATSIEKAELIGRPIGQVFSLVAVIALFILKAPVLFVLGASLGIAAGVIGFVIAAKSLFNHKKQSRDAVPASVDRDDPQSLRSPRFSRFSRFSRSSRSSRSSSADIIKQTETKKDKKSNKDVWNPDSMSGVTCINQKVESDFNYNKIFSADDCDNSTDEGDTYHLQSTP